MMSEKLLCCQRWLLGCQFREAIQRTAALIRDLGEPPRLELLAAGAVERSPDGLLDAGVQLFRRQGDGEEERLGLSALGFESRDQAFRQRAATPRVRRPVDEGVEKEGIDVDRVEDRE